MGGPGGIGGWDMNGPLGMVSVGQVGVEQSRRRRYACIVPGSLLDCRRPTSANGWPQPRLAARRQEVLRVAEHEFVEFKAGQTT